MEILYLWIRDYKNITNQGFNFGGELLFRYEGGYLDIEQNVMHIPGFFNIFPELGDSTSNILNISGIAGENGTGKTNLLDYLKYLTTHNIEDYILCYKGNDGGYYITGAKCNLRKSPVEIIRTSVNEIFTSCGFIYLSNILDITRREKASSKLFNISTNFLINKEGFEQFRASEFLRQITFAIDHKFSSLIDFKLPEKVICNLLTEITSDFLKELNSWYIDIMDQKQNNDQSIFLNKSIKNIKKLHGVFRELSKKQKQSHYYIQFISHIIMVFWLEILHLPRRIAEYLINHNTLFDDLIKHITKCLKDRSDVQVRDLEDFTINAINGFKVSLDNDLFKVAGYKNEIKNLKIIRKWQKITYYKLHSIENFTNIYQDESSSDCDTPMKISSKHILLKEFITNYLQSFNRKSYLHFEWVELSAGQVARLNIYSRLHYAMSILPEHLKDVVIIIDEGELYFHPEWQRKWLWYFLRAISSVYIGRRVQIIISTHSPFVLSDLPNQNVIFLKKGEHGVQVIEGLDDNQLTFASNINTLLSNSFFMDNGLVGEVAKIKINNLISLLNNKDPEVIRKNESQISKQLRYIGEPIIRNKLFNMLNNTLTVDYLQVQRRLDEIEKRLNNRGI
ncbi:AAA family ATPase [Bacillus sp. JJ1764]|uniref:AAA family ATPase n=1 Tax=Bacillus sp. JJ1764 TaxID=3122964 RepID=UPI003000F699